MLRVGLLGAGFLGKIHLSLLTEMNNIHFVGFYDTNIGNSSALNFKYGTKPFTNAKDLLEVSDALIIATPTKTHFEYVSRCILLKKSIFIEKPVTSTLEEANQLQSILKNSQQTVQVGMVERFNPAFTATLPYFTKIEKIFCSRLAPYTPRGADVSVVLDVMIHDLDIVLSLTNSEVKDITAYGEKIISDTFDIATVTVVFEDGLVANFSASRMAERKYRLAEFFEPENIYRIDFLHKKSWVYPLENSKRVDGIKTYLNNSEKEPIGSELPVIELNSIGEELKSFIDCIIHNKKVVVSLDDGIRAMEVAKAIEDQMNR